MSKPFKFFIGGFVLLLVLGGAAWVVVKVVLPGLGTYSQDSKVAFRDGLNVDGVGVDAGILLKQEWVDGVRDDFMDNFDGESSAVKSWTIYDTAPCVGEESKATGCISNSGYNRQESFYFAKHERTAVFGHLFNYFTALGLVPANVKFYLNDVEDGVAAANDVMVNGGDSVYVEKTSWVTFCVQDVETLKNVVGNEVASEMKVNIMGADKCVSGTEIFVAMFDNGVTGAKGVEMFDVQTNLGFNNGHYSLEPAVVPQIEGGVTYTYGEANAVFERETVEGDPCSPVPSLLIPHWVIWPGESEVRCYK